MNTLTAQADKILCKLNNQRHSTHRFGKLSVRIKVLNPSKFLKKIVTSNFRYSKIQLISVFYVFLKMSFWEAKKGQLCF